MKFDHRNKFDLCYYGQVISLRLKSNVASKWASKHLYGNFYYADNGVSTEQNTFFLLYWWLSFGSNQCTVQTEPCSLSSVSKKTPASSHSSPSNFIFFREDVLAPQRAFTSLLPPVQTSVYDVIGSAIEWEHRIPSQAV